MFRVNWLRPAAVPLCTNLLRGLTEEDADFLPQTCSFNLSLHYMVLICLIICSCGIQIKTFSRFLSFNRLSKCSFAKKKLIRSAATTVEISAGKIDGRLLEMRSCLCLKSKSHYLHSTRAASNSRKRFAKAQQ